MSLFIMRRTRIKFDFMIPLPYAHCCEDKTLTAREYFKIYNQTRTFCKDDVLVTPDMPFLVLDRYQESIINKFLYDRDIRIVVKILTDKILYLDFLKSQYIIEPEAIWLESGER